MEIRYVQIEERIFTASYNGGYVKIEDYNVPKELEPLICLGKRVLVPFGKQTLEGFIVNIKNKSDYELKDILEVVDSDVILNKELLELGKYIRLINEDVVEFLSTSRSKKQKEIVSYLLKNKNALTTMFDNASINALIKKRIIEKYSEEYYRIDDNSEIEDLVKLNPDQVKAYNEINESNKEVILLNGITGSGKTEMMVQPMVKSLAKKGR